MVRLLNLIITLTVGLTACVGDPLILTPYIASGRIEEARNLSLVTGITSNIESYSAFLTVDNKCDTNLYFWFFPSQNDWLNDPITLWLQGGPGLSSLKGLLQEHGPYGLNENGEIILREYTINRNSSVIYIDNPAGAGFSYSTGKCYDEEEVTPVEKLRQALDQFFVLFPEISKNSFYIAGEGYAGRFVTLLAFDNHIAEKQTFNLQGLIIGNGNGGISPPETFEVSDYLHQVGVADDTDVFLAKYYGDDVTRFCDDLDYGDASSFYQDRYLNVIDDATHFHDQNNLLYAAGEPLPEIEPFLELPQVREALHVGDIEFQSNAVIADKLYATIMRPARAQFEILLEHYRVLFYSGQLSLQFPYSSNRRLIEALVWPGAEEHRNADRKIWYVDDEIAGYVQSGGNLTEVLVRNAGRTVLADAPKWGLELYNKFLFNEPIVPN